MDNISCYNGCGDRGVQAETSTVRYLREQRHDFMNHMQVIWGYLQLNKPAQAMDYIVEMNGKQELMGRVLRLDCPQVSLLFYDCIRRSYNLGIDIDFDGDDASLAGFFKSRSRARVDILEKSFDNMLQAAAANEGSRRIYIDIYDEDGTLYIIFSDNPYGSIDEGDNGREGGILDVSAEDGVTALCRHDDEGTAIRICMKPDFQ